MQSIILAEVTRGGRVESHHTGAYAVADAQGRLVASGGDAERAIFPRSAIKIMQALPLLLDGTAERFAFSERELALACASHSGAGIHAETAGAMLARADRTPDCLECGIHWPTSPDAARALAAEGRHPSSLHNNCSGKHAGFVCSAVARGLDAAGYVQPDHPIMRAVKAATEAVLGITLDAGSAGIDGCSIPTFPLPLRVLAQGFARIGTGIGLPQDHQSAAARLRRAVAAEPDMIEGAGLFDTIVAHAFGEAIFLKSGAEGVVCGAIPAQGIGFAIKADDGAKRAAAAAAASLLRGLAGPHPVLDGLASPILHNWTGIAVGGVRGMLG